MVKEILGNLKLHLSLDRFWITCKSGIGKQSSNSDRSSRLCTNVLGKGMALFTDIKENEAVMHPDHLS